MGGMGSSVVRRELGRMLHELRVASGTSVRDLSVAKLGSKAKMSRVENGQQVIRVADVWAWCQLYGADRDTVAALSALAPGTQLSDWWEPSSVPLRFKLFGRLERAADRIRCFEHTYVSGIVQTEAYARGVIGADIRLSPEEVEERVRFRMQRQQRPLDAVTVVVAEEALRRVVGSPDVMAEQIERLRSSAAHIRVFPFSAGPTPLSDVRSWGMCDYAASEDPPVVYVAEAGGTRYLDKPRDRADYETAWRKVVSRAVPIGEWAT
jgi:transcriptional regulator with XRE-family HTH domain